MTLYSFRKMNPDWEMVLCLSQNNTCIEKWSTPESQDFLNYKGNDYLDRLSELNINIETVEFPSAFNAVITSPVHESDLYRYYKLYSAGGFYSDMDVLYFRSMGDIYNEITICEANTVLYTQFDHTAIGFLGAEKDNVFYKDLMMSALDTKDVSGYQSYGADLIYNFLGEYDIRDVVGDRYSELVVFVIPIYLIYQYNSKMIQYAFSNSLGVEAFNSRSIGYHWYAGSEIAQKFNNVLTEDNYTNYRTTFSEIAKEVLQ
jgi:hypothetical protein